MNELTLNVNYIIKRMFDICSSIVVLVVLIPFWLGCALAIKLDTKGPVLFSQKRRTKDGKIFKMYKFRSMVVNAESKGAGLFNYEDDPRVTKVGRFLRNTSIDELPQLINVLKGDISIVGPRPCVSYELGDYETLNKKYKKRFCVKGGITGLAQVRGRNDISWDEKVDLDNQYIDEFNKQGVLLDIQIIIETLVNVFKKSNIYETRVEGVDDSVKSAKLAEEEIIRIAHLPDTDSDCK